MVSKRTQRKLIAPNSFVSVKGNALEKDELYAGDLLYVIKLTPLPIDKDDLYMQRLHVLAHRAMGKGEVDASEALLIDPKDLVQLPAKANKTYMKAFEKFYSEKAEANSESTD